MKVKEVRTYQAVRFCQRLETFFTQRDVMPDVVMEATQYGVSVRMGEEDLVIPYANIAYFKPAREEAKAEGRKSEQASKAK